MKKMRPRDRIIIALDVGDAESCKNLLDILCPTIKMFKVGSQLFTAAGQEIINAIKRKSASVFLDLKFYDIPGTAAKAAASATNLGVGMFNMHALGGLEMMRKAAESSKKVSERLNIKHPLLLGVTVLTSMDKKDLEGLGIDREPGDLAIFLAELAKKAGLDGVVASAEEIRPIKKRLGEDFVVVVPGIRPAWAGKDDQKRTATPREALERGADYIVIGRPVIEAEDPKAAVERIIGEIE